MCSVGVRFVSPRLSGLFYTISIEDSAFVAIQATANNKRYLGLQVECPILLPDLNQIAGSSTDFRKGLQYKISMEIRPVGDALIHEERLTNGRRDMTKVIGDFRDNANAPNLM